MSNSFEAADYDPNTVFAELEHAAKLIELTGMVAEGCMALSQVTVPTLTEDVKAQYPPFSVLLENSQSPYRGYRNDQKAYLQSLGHSGQNASEAVNYYHDTRHTPVYWGDNNGVVKRIDFPEYPVGSRRAKALSIAEPYVLKKAVENRYYPFNNKAKAKEIAVELIFRNLQITNEDLVAIQTNLDNWGIDNTSE